jgi:hypothetical protein
MLKVWLQIDVVSLCVVTDVSEYSRAFQGLLGLFASAVDTTILRNVGKHPPNDTASHPRRLGCALQQTTETGYEDFVTRHIDMLSQYRLAPLTYSPGTL